jgi:multiple antibiotic resistance protein
MRPFLFAFASVHDVVVFHIQTVRSLRFLAARAHTTNPRRDERNSCNTLINNLANAFLLVYAGLFPIVNPVGGAPIFVGLTEHCTDDQRNALALRVTLNSFFLLLGSLLGGSYVLEFFGITLPIVRVAGGLVVTATGWNLLQAGEQNDTRSDRKPEASIDAFAFYPLTMPITVGPGSIAVAISIGSERPRGADLAYLALLGSAAIAGLVAIAATVYVCYRFAEETVSALGQQGTNVVVRLSAFILMCIGIQIMWSGYSALVHVAS